MNRGSKGSNFRNPNWSTKITAMIVNAVSRMRRFVGTTTVSTSATSRSLTTSVRIWCLIRCLRLGVLIPTSGKPLRMSEGRRPGWAGAPGAAGEVEGEAGRE